MQYSICKKLGTEATESWYSNVLKSPCERDITVLRNQGVRTDTEILANRANVIIKNKMDGRGGNNLG
jgi:hypothetical protein